MQQHLTAGLMSLWTKPAVWRPCSALSAPRPSVATSCAERGSSQQTSVSSESVSGSMEYLQTA